MNEVKFFVDKLKKKTNGDTNVWTSKIKNGIRWKIRLGLFRNLVWTM
jgi:hypothetical protein